MACAAPPCGGMGTRMAAPRLLVVLLAVLGLAACDDGKPAGAAREAGPPPAVFVTRVERQSITPGSEFIGRAEAIDKVEVRARVTGFLQARHFKEGEDLAAGAPLFTIEQGPFAAEVKLREADVARARAELHEAQLQVDRGRELVRTNNIPQSQLDQRIAARDVAQAKLAGAEAQLQQAVIEYGYTQITVPFAGRASRSPLSPGNVVGPDSGVLVTIVRDDPVRILFPVTQRELLRFRRAGGEEGRGGVRVLVRLPDGSMLDGAGRLSFVNVTTERATDSVLVEAIVPNPQRLLSDGQAVTVVVQLETPQEAIVIPQSAVQIDQAGPFVLVVGAENRVEQKRVRLGRGPAGQNVVTEGLEVGQLIITEGAQRARPGSPVTPRPAGPPPLGAAPARAG
jgi:membrane fusion protein (multidrug efflux system)